ncbi:MAG: methionine gamma-lyase family protein [Caldisericia bacterium]
MLLGDSWTGIDGYWSHALSAISSALKSAYLFSSCLTKLGFKVYPNITDKRADIVTSIELGSREIFIEFGRAIQSVSPIDGNATPEPFAQGGYESDVLLAGGGFVAGSTLELSCDGLDEDPYIMYIQGGINMNHARLGLSKVIEALDRGV